MVLRISCEFRKTEAPNSLWICSLNSSQTIIFQPTQIQEHNFLVCYFPFPNYQRSSWKFYCFSSKNKWHWQETLKFTEPKQTQKLKLRHRNLILSCKTIPKSWRSQEHAYQYLCTLSILSLQLSINEIWTRNVLQQFFTAIVKTNFWLRKSTVHNFINIFISHTETIELY